MDKTLRVINLRDVDEASFLYKEMDNNDVQHAWFLIHIENLLDRVIEDRVLDSHDRDQFWSMVDYVGASALFSIRVAMDRLSCEDRQDVSLILGFQEG